MNCNSMLDASISQIWELSQRVNVFLVRHGQQRWSGNAYQYSHSAHLTAIGTKQSCLIGQTLKSLCDPYDSVRVVCSDMLQARETARHIITQIPAATLQVYETKKEVSYDINGFKEKQILWGIQEQYFGNYDRALNNTKTTKDQLPDSESFSSLTTRAVTGIEDIITQASREHVNTLVIVTHFYTVKAFLCTLSDFEVTCGRHGSFNPAAILRVTPTTAKQFIITPVT